MNQKKTNPCSSAAIISVAIFVDGLSPQQSCVAASSVHYIRKALDANQKFKTKKITPQEIENEDALLGVHVLVFPGGLEQKMKVALGASAIQKIQAWRKETCGGLLGICAGAVFLCAQGRRGRGLIKGVEMVQDEKFHQAGLQGVVTVEPTEAAPSKIERCITATERGKTEEEKSSRFLYYCGPVFRVKSSKNKDHDDSMKRVCSWANFTSDLAEEELSHLQSTTPEYTQGNCNKQSGRWVCLSCRQSHPKKKKACCGESQREQKRLLKTVENLVGAMPGSAAVVAEEVDCVGNIEDTVGISRTVLFGPHPEFGGTYQQKLLRHAVSWVAAPAIEQVQ